MGRNKLERFEYNSKSPYVVEPGKEIFENAKGNWHKTIFGNEAPITLEMGCGKGEYTIGLANLFPERNFIGVDIKGARIWKGANEADAQDLKNVRFLRTEIMLINNTFEENEVDEIWVTFPDPRPKEGDEKRRLISPKFLNFYREFVRKDGIIHLKTDNHPLYLYALEVIEEEGLRLLAHTDDLYDSPLESDCHGIKTTFEKTYLAKNVTINYVRFQLNKGF